MERGDKWGLWDGHVHTGLFTVDNQQESTVQHRELCSALCNNLNGKRFNCRRKERGDIVHAWLIHFAVQQKLAQHCKINM